MTFRVLPKEIQDLFGEFAYAVFQPSPEEEKIIQKYTKSTETSNVQVTGNN